METIHKHIVLGILAHVDSGKTTLSEAMLYRSGAIRKLGRVDHKDAFLDTDALEKARGITIFSKQALLTAGSTDITLLDTPGHVDFSTETERTLQVLDYAVLVVSGTDGVQSHTETLWRLLRRYHVPTFVFVNKTDLPGKSKEELLAQLNHRLGEGFVDFGMPQADRDDALALCDENLMNRMLEAGQLADAEIIPAIARRHVFPCWFGSALKLDGVEELLTGLDRLTRPAPALDVFGAKVFKVSQDEQGARLTWLRVTGGELKVKAQLSGEADGEPWAEKANQLRLYSGTKYTLAETILVQRLLPGFAGSAVLDADGLNAAAQLLAEGKALPHPTGELILTPHPGEMARLTGLSVAEISADREKIARQYAKKWNVVVVLKGSRTVVAAPDGRACVNPTGNPGLARGGSGDVLAGMTAALLACRLPAFEAASCAVYLHGAAADRAAALCGEYGMLPHDILPQLGRMFAENQR